MTLILPAFKVVVAALKRYLRAAPGVVEARVQESARMLDGRRRNEAEASKFTLE